MLKKIKLKFKILIGFILLDLLVSGLLGTFLYKISDSIYFDSFIQHKLSLARSISYTFNGIELSKLAEPRALKLDKFWEIYNHILKVEKKEKHVVWIFALYYDRAKDEMHYAIDGTIFDLDTVWIENKNFGLQFYKNKNQEYVIRWNANEESLPFTIKIGDSEFLFNFDRNEKYFSINQTKLFQVLDTDSLSVKMEDATLGKDNRDFELDIKLNGKDEKLVFSYAEKNSLSSIPGLSFKEDKNLINRFINSLDLCEPYVPKDLERTSYGLFLYTGEVIRDPNGQCNGMLFVTSTLNDVYDFRSKLLYSAILISIFTFFITLFSAYILSNYISNPLNKLSIAVQEVSAGNLGIFLEITSGDEFEFLAKEFNMMTESLRNANAEKIKLVSMEKELSLAKKIQDSALPKTIPRFSGLDIHVLYQPMELVGGDYYDFCIIDSNRIGVLIADVAGHGVSAAIIASMLSIAFKNHFNYAEFPEIMLSRMNRTMLGKCGNMFLTAAYLVVDMEAKVIHFANAGHPFGYLYRSETNEFIYFDSKGRLMGVFPELHSIKMEISFEAGDRIILFTDGIIESRNKKNILFEEERLKEIITRESYLNPSELSKKILSDLEGWQESKIFGDDLTLIIIDC